MQQGDLIYKALYPDSIEVRLQEQEERMRAMRRGAGTNVTGEVLPGPLSPEIVNIEQTGQWTDDTVYEPKLTVYLGIGTQPSPGFIGYTLRITPTGAAAYEVNGRNLDPDNGVGFTQTGIITVNRPPFGICTIEAVARTVTGAGTYGPSYLFTVQGDTEAPDTPTFPGGNGWVLENYFDRELWCARLRIKANRNTEQDVAKYYFQHSVDGGVTWKLSPPVPHDRNRDPELLIDVLPPGTVVIVQALAVDTSGNTSAWTTPGVNTITAEAPSVVGMPVLDIVSSNLVGDGRAAVEITLTPPQLPEGYEVQGFDLEYRTINVNEEQAWSYMWVALSPNPTSVSNLTTGVDWQFRARVSVIVAVTSLKGPYCSPLSTRVENRYIDINLIPNPDFDYRGPDYFGPIRNWEVVSLGAGGGGLAFVASLPNMPSRLPSQIGDGNTGLHLQGLNTEVKSDFFPLNGDGIYSGFAGYGYAISEQATNYSAFITIYNKDGGQIETVPLSTVNVPAWVFPGGQFVTGATWEFTAPAGAWCGRFHLKNTSGDALVVDKVSVIRKVDSSRLGTRQINGSHLSASVVSPGTAMDLTAPSGANSAIIARARVGQTADVLQVLDASGNPIVSTKPNKDVLMPGRAVVGGTTAPTSVEPLEVQGSGVAGLSLHDRTGGAAERWVIYSTRTGGAGTQRLRFFTSPSGDKFAIDAVDGVQVLDDKGIRWHQSGTARARETVGPSFPSGPVDGDIHFHTTHKVQCFYRTGIGWVGPDTPLQWFYRAGFTQGQTYAATASTFAWATPPSYANIVVTRINYLYNVSGTHDANNRWAFRLGAINAGNGGSVIRDLNSFADRDFWLAGGSGTERTTGFQNNPLNFAGGNVTKYFVEVIKVGNPNNITIDAFTVLVARIYT